MPHDHVSTLIASTRPSRTRALRHWLRARLRLLRFTPRPRRYFDEAERAAYLRRIAEMRAEAACHAPRRF